MQSQMHFAWQMNYNRLLITIFMTKLDIKDLLNVTDLIHLLAL